MYGATRTCPVTRRSHTRPLCWSILLSGLAFLEAKSPNLAAFCAAGGASPLLRAQQQLSQRSIPCRGLFPRNVPWTSMAAPELDVLCKLDGKAAGLEEFSSHLRTLEPGCADVSSVQVVNENKFPTSLSAELRLTLGSSEERSLFVKKVTAKAMEAKPWADRRRTLMYVRNELRVYKEFSQELSARGVLLPKLAGSDENFLGSLGGQLSEAPGPEPSAEELAACGAIMYLESAGDGYVQASPISTDQAKSALAAIASFHGACWEDALLLDKASTRLQQFGGSFALSIRNPKELGKLQGSWERFVDTFRGDDPELFAQPGIPELGQRLEAWSAWVARELSPNPGDPFATLIHGDYKAMNVFLPREKGAPAMLIDFASTGVGLGMADVAMLLSHSVAPSDLDAPGGEEALIDSYLEALGGALRARGGGLEPPGREDAMRQYRLAVVDYGRFMVSRFWGDASLKEAFAKKSDSPNTTLPNRSIPAALSFVRRVDVCLRHLEREGKGPKM